MNKKELTLLLNSAPVEFSVDIALDSLGETSIIDLLDYDNEVFEIFLTAIARPVREEGIRDMSALTTEILSTIQELRKRAISLAKEAEVSMKKLVNQETN